MSFTLNRALPAVIALSAFVLAGSPAHANLLLNGSFESGIPDPGAGFTTPGPGSTNIDNWTISGPAGSSIDYIGGYWQADDGVRSVDLAGSTPANASLSQSFTAVVGQQYQVSFLLSGNPDGPPPIKSVAVSLDTLIPTLFATTYDTTAQPTTRADMGWVLTTFLFVADKVSQTIKFSAGDAGNYGAAIDAVEISAVPLPPALLLFGSALLGMNWLRRRRGGKASLALRSSA